MGWRKRARRRASAKRPYERWFELQDKGKANANLYYPVYGKLKKSCDARGNKTYAATIATILGDEQARVVAVDGTEHGWLNSIKSGLDGGRVPDALLYVVVYCPVGLIDTAAFTDLIAARQLGPPVPIKLPLARNLTTTQLPPPGQAAERQDSPPIIGVIDDCIPYLNGRTRKPGGEKTRFLGVWLQSRERQRETWPDDYFVEIGTSLRRSNIDSVFTRDGARPDEAAEYRGISREIYPLPDRRMLEYASTHGAGVLDRAAGWQPGEPDPDEAEGFPFADMDILAVQLPPHAVADTSGRRFTVHVIQALRWIVHLAMIEREERVKEDPQSNKTLVVPLIVNLSLGAQAGPKDATELLDEALAREIRRYRDRASSPMRIVLAYGNAHRTRQTAAVDLRKTAREMLDWRILPDDRSSSFVEIRADKPARLRIVSPEGQAFSAVVGAPDKEHFLTDGDGKTIAALYCDLDYRKNRNGEPAIDHAGRLLAVRPTVADANGPGAPAGCWKIAVGPGPKGEKGLVTLEIQRDDTPSPYRPLGRQSYFSHPGAYAFDPETADYSAPADGSPIRREGNHAAHGAAEAAASTSDTAAYGIYTVGAAVNRRLDAAAGYPPARYSPSGFRTVSGLSRCETPSLSAVADDSFNLSGVRVSGVLSGSSMRLSGTSAAAPMVTRRLAMRSKLLPVVLGDEDAKATEVEKIGDVRVTADGLKHRLGRKTVAESG